jgi:hypothetical protein
MIMIFVRVQKIQPPPHDLINLWEDYCFMLLYAGRSVTTHVALHTFDYSMTLQACPQLSRYIHAFRIIFGWPCYDTPNLWFFDICLLLDWSWHDMRAALSPLRAILGSDDKKLAGLLTSLSATDPPLFRKFCSNSTIQDLARNCLHTMKRLFANQLPWDPFWLVS